MSGGNPCICEGTKEERMKYWRVRYRNCNYSYFEYPKGQKHYSDYSLVVCLRCTGCFRTKANYVHELKDEEKE